MLRSQSASGDPDGLRIWAQEEGPTPRFPVGPASMHTRHIAASPIIGRSLPATGDVGAGGL